MLSRELAHGSLDVTAEAHAEKKPCFLTKICLRPFRGHGFSFGGTGFHAAGLLRIGPQESATWPARLIR